jgi:2-polyprenyl-3-methyl-5-hydroxy-6-metoxy-1,4-benzoquinol methylase
MSPVSYEQHTLVFGAHTLEVRTLHDRNQLKDGAGQFTDGVSSASWSLTGVIWPDSNALASMMVDYDIGERRVLEVGCGIGVPSMILSQRGADVTATDNNALAGRMLLENAERNGGRAIPFVGADWADDKQGCTLGRFDLIVASGVLYEPNHAEDLCNFVERHACRKSEVLVVDARRGEVGRFNRHMHDSGYERTELAPPLPNDGDEPHHVRIMRYDRTS